TPRRVLPAPPGVQVLRRQDRLHQLQGRAAADAVHPGARQDSAAADFGDLRGAPAEAADRDRPRAAAGADSVCDRLKRGRIDAPTAPTRRHEGTKDTKKTHLASCASL